ncbi:MAG: hypothetical protein H6909_04520 [Rickettsiaceae bacterium]|nr:hypothetical protein [Rickettsiaceae bacterium]
MTCSKEKLWVFATGAIIDKNYESLNETFNLMKENNFSINDMYSEEQGTLFHVIATAYDPNLTTQKAYDLKECLNILFSEFTDSKSFMKYFFRKDGEGKTPLHIAHQECHQVFVDAVLKKLQDPNYQCPDTDLEQQRDQEIIISQMSDDDVKLVMQQDNQGNTPLHYIVAYKTTSRMLDIYELPLTDKQIDLLYDIKNYNGISTQQIIDGEASLESALESAIEEKGPSVFGTIFGFVGKIIYARYKALFGDNEVKEDHGKDLNHHNELYESTTQPTENHSFFETRILSPIKSFFSFFNPFHRSDQSETNEARVDETSESDKETVFESDNKANKPVGIDGGVHIITQSNEKPFAETIGDNIETSSDGESNVEN